MMAEEQMKVPASQRPSQYKNRGPLTASESGVWSFSTKHITEPYDVGKRGARRLKNRMENVARIIQEQEQRKRQLEKKNTSRIFTNNLKNILSY